MTTLATASVELVADGSRLPASISQEVNRTGAAVQRSGRDIGRNLGTAISTGAQSAMRGVSQAVTRGIGAISTGFQGVSSAAAGLLGSFQRVGTVAASALTPALNGIGRFRDGFSNAGAAASAFSGTMGTLGGVTRTAVNGIASGFSRIRGSIDTAAQGATLFNSTLGRMGALAGGLAAAAGIATLGAEIGRVASSAQTTEASLSALYGAAGAGAEVVNETMSEMATRFRGLDMSVMNEGATTLAYMGLQGTEAVDVLERLDMATTAAGTGATGMTRALDAMTKGVNAGKFQMGELSQISNAGIPIYDALAEVLGVDIPEAQAMASAGAIDLEDVLEALSGEAGTWFPALLEGADAVSQTFSGSWDTIRNTFVNGLANELVPLLDNLSPVMARVATAVGDGFEALPGLIESVVSRASDSGAFDTLTSIFDGMRDVISSLTPLFAGFASGFQSVSVVALNLIGQLQPLGGVLSSFGGFLRDNADALRIFGTLLGGLAVGLGVYRTAALLATLASQALAVGFKGIGVAIRGIPLIGWALAAIGALIALYQASDRFREIVNTAFAGVRDAVMAAWTFIQPVWERMVEWLSNLWDAVSGWEGWSAAWQGIREAVSNAWGVISGIWESITGAWDSLTSATTDTSWWTTTWDTITGAAETAWSFISGIFEQIAAGWGTLTGLLSGDIGFSDIGEFLSDSFSRLTNIGSDIGGFLVEQLRELPSMAISALSSFASTVGGFLYDQIRTLPGRIIGGLSDLSDAVSEFVTSIPERISQAMGSGDGIVDWIQELPGLAIERLTAFGTTIVDYVKGIPEMISNTVDPGAIVEWLHEVPSRITEFMSEYGENILRGIAIAIGVVTLGIPALLLGLLAAILVVLGTIAWELIQWAWGAFSSMMVSAGEAISAGIDSIVTWFAELPGRVMESIAEFGVQLMLWGTLALAALRSAFTSGLTALTTLWSTAWTGLRTMAATAWTGIVSWATTQAGLLRDRVMGPVNTLRDRMIAAFAAARSGIGEAWTGLKKVVAEPINWVIQTAYTNGIKNVWDRVATKFGGSKLPDAPAALAFASGGVFPGYTPGRDVHAVPMAAFSGGESVLRPEVTRAWGAGTTHWLNRVAMTGGVSAVRRALSGMFSGQAMPTSAAAPAQSAGGGYAARFATGGVIGGAAGRAWEWLQSAADDFAEGMADFLDDPSGVFKNMINGLVDWSSIPGAGNDWGKIIVKIPKEMLDELAKKAKELFGIDSEGDWINIGGNIGGRLGSALAFAKAQAGKPYGWGAVGPGSYDCSGFMSAIHNVILGKRPYSRRYTTHSFNGNSANGFRRNFPSPFTIGNTHANVGHMAGTLLKTNVESRGSVGVVVGSRARGTTNPLFSSRWGLVTGGASKSGGRLGGEGVLYDRGGTLWPGTHLVTNKSGKPESIRTYAQERNVSRLVKMVEPALESMSTLQTNRMDAGDAAQLRQLLGESQGAGTVVNAPVTVNTISQDPVQVAYKVSSRIAQMAGI